jgi:hypothetical protein
MMTSLRSKSAVGNAIRAGLAVEGAYLGRCVTDEQRSRRPIFNATLRAAASWLFFRVARSTRMNPDMRDGALTHRYMPPGTLVADSSFRIELAK